MKKLFLKWGHVIASMAFFAAVYSANITCAHSYYQPQLPDSAKKLRKF
ncbi:MAG: cyclic lactone autoinducer peptide [Clostridium sp.]|nr:cyclic lactone autoinducer peptide [Clostridium sp.]